MKTKTTTKTTTRKVKAMTTETVIKADHAPSQRSESVESYLSLPYARRLVPDPDGGFVGTIQEFPGCIAEGESAQEALENLDASAASWIESQIELGQEIPKPIDYFRYSGKIALRIPRGIHKQVAELASSEQTSVNQLLLSAIASYVSAKGVVGKIANDFSHLMARQVQSHISNRLRILKMYERTSMEIDNASSVFMTIPDIKIVGVGTGTTMTTLELTHGGN
ncbi:MAG: toxin-antitoxin system HicB family antitoxin [Rhodanobacter sp.]